ncbi:hypothetical protein SM124_12320 [Bacillus sp. 31A1R]|uniref:LPS export ABC transporter periplasmic protein LptC n=1 Tax=Robertmurraya mangrovi TaxID=3098077 RepID=A0ABU5IZH6_9BACI|nr:hypothetical protein [Bacillus sp. 31A1R]MDZ5472536.1 hypothetical protein [Bacillus sp. 31A1R]
MESKKEKRIRFFLVLFFISLTGIGFFYKYNGFNSANQKKETYKPQSLVIHKSTNEKDNPIVILYEYKQNQHILALYEIEMNNAFKFKTLEAVTLKLAPEKLAYDKEGQGIWANLNGDWVYFNRKLETVESSNKARISSQNIPFTVDLDENKKVIHLPGTHQIEIGKQESVFEVQSLSENHELWLVLTDMGVKISTIETK